MWGSIIGDIVGSRFERHNIKTKRFKLFTSDCRFTDDTVMVIGTAEALLKDHDFTKSYCKWGRKYPHAGYGKGFKQWINNPVPYNSWGNGSAMRVSPVAYTSKKSADCLRIAKNSAIVSHNHEEGIKGAQATVYVQWMCLNRFSKEEIKKQVERKFYPLSKSIRELKKTYKFDVSCQGSVPVAIQAFLESRNFTDSIRIAVSVGGDTDTIASITGSFSQCYYKKIPTRLINKAKSYLTPELLKIINKFNEAYDVKF